MENNIFHTVAVGSDHAGFTLKSTLITWLAEHGYETLDCGCYTADSVDYPDIAKETCKAVTDKRADCAVLICGTGIGVSLAANKVKGIRCALCSEPVSAKLTREHNNANMLAFGARLIGTVMAEAIVDAFVETPFSFAERHVKRIDMISRIENGETIE